jgi:transcriptional regulator with XRE-family HTH domain
MNSNNISRNLKYLRKKKGLTQFKLRSSLGITRSTWSNYENGLTTPSIEHLIKFSNHFGLSLDDLIVSDLQAGDPHPNKPDKKHPYGKPIAYAPQPAITIVSDPPDPDFDYLMGEIKKIQDDLNMIKEGKIKM